MSFDNPIKVALFEIVENIHILVFIFAVSIIYFNYWRAKNFNNTLKELAREMNLTFSKRFAWSLASLKGNYWDRKIQFKIITKGSGKSKKNYTLFKVEHNANVPADIILYHEGISSKLYKLIGFKELKVGVKNFDDKFMIRSKDEGSIEVLTTTVQHLLDKMQYTPKITTMDLQVEIPGLFQDKQEIKKIFTQLIELARTMEYG